MHASIKSRSVNRLFASVCLFFLICGSFLLLARTVYPPPAITIGHDQVVYIVEAQRFLSGAQPYGPQLAETNPPWIIWFSALPVLLSHWFHHGDAIFFLRLLVTVMIVVSAFWCVRILRRYSLATSLTAAPFGCLILAIEYFIGDIDFGQREHLLVILLVPFLMAVVTGAVSRLTVAERCALGIAAGVGLWFKPQEVSIVVALELFLALRRRSLHRLLSPELLALAISCFTILGLVRIYTPLYLKEFLPLLGDTYWAYATHTALALALHLWSYSVCLLAVLSACLLLRKVLPDVATPMALLLCSATASVAYDVQHTMWLYHLYPAIALLHLAMAYLLIDLLGAFIRRSKPNMQLARRAVIIGGGIMASSLGIFALSNRIPGPWKQAPAASVAERSAPPVKPDEIRLFLAQIKPSTTVYVFSTSVPALSIAYRDHLNWGSRFPCLWILPAIAQNQLGRTGPASLFKPLSPEKLASLSSLQRTEMAEDLDFWRPSIVVVEHCTVTHACQGIGNKNFDMLSWFLQQPAFTAAWSHYHRRAIQLEDYDVYQRDK